jgi:hypothetical protein
MKQLIAVQASVLRCSVPKHQTTLVLQGRGRQKLKKAASTGANQALHGLSHIASDATTRHGLAPIRSAATGNRFPSLCIRGQWEVSNDENRRLPLIKRHGLCFCSETPTWWVCGLQYQKIPTGYDCFVPSAVGLLLACHRGG